MDALWGLWVAGRWQRTKDEVRVDADSICSALIAGCHPKQRAFVLDPGRRPCALVARGGGKTTAGRVRFLLKMLKVPKARCLFIATTRPQAEEFMWEPLKALCEKLEIPATFNETKLQCRFTHNGSTLRLVGCDNKKEIGKLRGQPFHEVGIDESASYPLQLFEDLLFRIIGPRLGDFGGKMWIIGTPGHILSGVFYDATRAGSPISRHWNDRDKPEYFGWKRWSFHNWTMQDGAPYAPALDRLWKEALIEKESNGWTDDNPVWRREFLGLWAADDTENVYRYRPHNEDGSEHNIWCPEVDREGFAVLPKEFSEWSYSYGMDMGHSDPFALTVFAWSPQDPKKTLYHCYEFSRTEMFPEKIAELLIGSDLDATNPQGCIGHTGWPDAMVADIAGMGGAILDQLAQVNGIRIQPAEKKNKHDAIELFNGDLIDGRIKIMEGSALAVQLMTLQWAVDDYGRLKEHKSMRNDLTDSAIYSRRAASHLLFEEESPKAPYFPKRADPMLVEEDIDSEDDFSDILGNDYYDGF